MRNYDDIGREVREMEKAVRFARDPGFADNIKSMVDKDFSIYENAAQRADEAAAMLREDPTRGVLWEDLARRQQDFDRIRARVEALPDVSASALPNVNIGALPKVGVVALPDVNFDALASAERVATQALKSYSAPNFGDLLPKNLDQFQDLIGRATSLATAPSTQEFLRNADEAMAAARGVPVEEQPLDSVDLDDLPDIPELNWMLQLDRDTLIF